jgi:hypothetical protein
MPTKTQREREAEQREAKLTRIQEQVEDGSLVIRQMTDAERARFSKEGTSTDAERGTTKRRDRRTRTRAASRPMPPARRG